MSSQLRLLSLSLSYSLALMLVACGGETKPAAADAKSPDKGATAPVAKAENADHAEVAKPAGADKTKVIDGADPIDDRYALRIDPPADAVAGREGTVKLTVVPKAPWHMNLDFPTSLAIAAPDGVTLAKAEMKKADADKLDENSAEYSVKFTPAAAGDKSFTGKFKFAVCQDEACSPVTEEVEFKVAVK